MNKKKILLVWNDFNNMGGIESMILRFLDHLDLKKYDITICCLFEEGKHINVIKKYGIQMYCWYPIK